MSERIPPPGKRVPRVEVVPLKKPAFSIKGLVSPEVISAEPEAAARLLNQFNFSREVLAVKREHECLTFAMMLKDDQRKALAEFLYAVAELKGRKRFACTHEDAFKLVATVKPIKERFAKVLPRIESFLDEVTDELYQAVETLNPPQEDL